MVVLVILSDFVALENRVLGIYTSIQWSSRSM
jgi:hypothetical protein